MKKIRMLAAGIAVMACSSKTPKDNPVLVEANQVHLEAEAIQEKIEPEIEKIDSLKNLLAVRKTAKADSLVNDLSKLNADFEDWEKNFFAVPGFEHTHEEGHEHHNHDHTPAPELPADKMLEVQKEIKANIESIEARLNNLLAQIQEALK
ncbi:hypothetical protein [Emticicia soli]|uniref:Uncharacterized protein n=1 Tax=Emticicia soli TaxID=2027878 RepID=A0ABW5JGP3_9BACT